MPRIRSGHFFRNMDIKSWFDSSGTYAEGVKLYSKLPNCNNQLIRSFSRENSSNFIKLKYELKKALMCGLDTVTPITDKKPTELKKPIEKEVKKEPLLKLIIQQSAAVSFEKETMAMYPMELHSIYRERVNNFYQACELKFQLNAVSERDEAQALKLIIQLEDLWTKIDKAWIILDHWKDHNRIMPTEESEDFSKLNGIQLCKKRDNLESSISKRTKTIKKMKAAVEASPENRSMAKLLLRKLEQLQQLTIDLATIRNLLKNE